jgi:lysophospholipase L1-like esterase
MRKLQAFFLVCKLTCLLIVACLQFPAQAGADELAIVADSHTRLEKLASNNGDGVNYVAETAVAKSVAANDVAMTWRVMPIGDSITNGSGSRNSYRRTLWQKLVDAAIPVDFVGSRVTAVPNPDFDLDHEGHSGWTADDFLQTCNIDSWAQIYVPDVILIHLGTNDLRNGESVSTTVNEIGQIIDIVRTSSPEVIVFVAQIIPMSNSTSPTVMELNNAIPALVASKDSISSPVRIVDHFTGFDPTVDTLDGIHPNIAGEEKMSQRWFDAMQPLLVVPVNEAPQFTSVPVTAATQSVPYSYVANVVDPNAGDTVVISAPEKPQWLILVDNGDGTASLTGTPGNSDVGAHSVRLVATDQSDLSNEQVFTIDVENVNDAPFFTSTPVTAATEGVVYSYTMTLMDPDADAVSISALQKPEWLSLIENGDDTATLAGTPSGVHVGAHSVDLEARETATSPGLSVRQSFVITVTSAPEGPEISLIGDSVVTITVGDVYSDAGATASDAQDGDLTSQIVVENSVDSSVAATYMVSYAVTDSAGNETRTDRTVIVQAAPSKVGQQSGSGGGVAGILELLVLLAIAATGFLPRTGAGRQTPGRSERNQL